MMMVKTTMMGGHHQNQSDSQPGPCRGYLTLCRVLRGKIIIPWQVVGKFVTLGHLWVGLVTAETLRVQCSSW